MVLAKAPVPGRVKTRLSPPCTPGEAAALAEAALADTLEVVGASPAERRVLVLDGPPGDWLPPGFEVLAQRGRGLDERLAEAFRAVGGPAFLVGMDTPQIDTARLADAVDRLDRPGIDAVLGPAADGGWWGIGLRRADPRVFLGVPMSRPFTGAAQAARLDTLGLRWTRLEPMRDVDRFADAMAVAEAVPSSRFGRVVREVAVAVTARSGAPAGVGAVG